MIHPTTFDCKICGEPIEFNISDASTYISMKKQESFFGMELNTYRVAHVGGNTRHVNSVIVDHMGLFRGFVDAYGEQLEEGKEKPSLHVVLNERTRELGVPFVLFYLVDENLSRVTEYVNQEGIDTQRFLEMSTRRIEEAKSLYRDRNFFSFSLADLEVSVVYLEKTAVLYSTRRGSGDWGRTLYHILEFAGQERDQGVLSSTMQLFLIITERLGVDEINVDSIAELVTNPYLDVPIEVKYPEHVPRIVRRVSDEFGIPQEVLDRLFRGKQTLLQAIEDQPEKFQSFHEMLKFVNRRRLLG